MDNLLENLNEEQLAAVTHTGGPLMIVAGAGTGKTTVITQRIAWLIEQGQAKPENILALTFTEKAAAEMEERVDRLLPMGYVDLQISTFHAFCEKLLRDHGVEMGLSRDFTVVDELSAWLLVRKHFDRFNLDYYRPLGNPTKYIRSLLTHFSRAKDEAVTADDYLKYADGLKANTDSAQSDEDANTEAKRAAELAEAYHTYQTILQENDALDFGDLIMYALQLLEKRPRVLAEVRKQYTHVLVDEFQDTNWAQYELIKRVAAPANRLTVVGDDDQSIYKFRGASLSNILQFEGDFPGAKRVILTKNYRTVQAILDRAYAFIQMNNPNRLETQPGAAGREPPNKHLASQRDTDGFVEHMHFATLDEEVKGVAEKIVELKEMHPDATWGEFVILVRANSSADEFVAAFERFGIPYRFMALRGLYTKLVIIDMLAWMRAIDHPHDSPSLYRILSHAMFDFPTHDIVSINHAAFRKGRSLYEICRSLRVVPDLDAQTVSRIESILSKFQTLALLARKATVGEIFVSVAKESGLIEFVNGQSEQQKRDSFRYLHDFYERVKRFDAQNPGSSLHAFLEEFEHERDAGEEGALKFDIELGPDVVQIMTVHASKGLEFRFVFVVNLVDKRFPSVKRSDPIELPLELIKEKIPEGDVHLEEERRLFYVAMTRAKDRLYLTSADDYGGARKKKLSRFLHELGISAVARASSAKGPFVEEAKSKIEPQQRLAIPIPKQFSFTQLAAFKTCPLQYKFAHILRVPVFGKWTLSFGKTMHNALHSWFTLWLERNGTRQQGLFDAPTKQQNGAVPVTTEELLACYEESWIDDWYPNDAIRNEYRAKGKTSLAEYARQTLAAPPKPLALEQGFTLKIKDVTLKGRIDRIDAFEDGIEIIDYKTGTPKAAEELTKEDKQQLLLYQIAAEEVLGLKPRRLTFHYLENNQEVTFLGSAEELTELKEEVHKQVESLKTSSFQATPGFLCRFCDFADICEFRES